MEVKMGLYKTIEKMYPDLSTIINIGQQLEKFKKAEGLFGMSMAILTREKGATCYGEECKELQNLAIRVLSLTCSTTGCKRNWSTFEYEHSKKGNRLEQQRLNALVFVKYNIQLELRQEKREKKDETYDPICLIDMESDDEWITEVEDACLPQDNSWMDMNECFEDDGGLGSNNKRKRGPRNLKLDRKRKGKALVDEEEVEEADDDEEANTEEEEQEDVMVEDDDDADDDDDEGLQI
ncbi:protein FAM50A-like [Dioscorea cayenensis subsp. rotundata]|uniref:Protein FAM50A-like n=1 Tax=Dioscorea cayennensis subsp. rotundata TaxID=55577 RepID=A0AB40CYP5_DIOCR|nr:protein FAM50A-like [Dioscorea cayenensis subsp. rotundata]